MHYANGNSYEGDWVNGKFHGTGTYVWASGSYYKGEYVFLFLSVTTDETCMSICGSIDWWRWMRGIGW